MRDFLTMKQVAEMIGVHPVTINRFCKAGKISFHQVGSRKRFTPEDVAKYQEESRHAADHEKRDPFNPD